MYLAIFLKCIIYAFFPIYYMQNCLFVFGATFALSIGSLLVYEVALLVASFWEF